MVMIAPPSGPSARKAKMPPVINPGTVVCSHGDAGIENVELPKPASSGVSPVRWKMGGGTFRPRVESRIRSTPGSARADKSPNDPRTGSSQTRTSDWLAIDTVVAQAVEADVREVGQAVVLGTHGNLRDQLTGDGAHHVHGGVVAARRPELSAVGADLQHVRAAPAGDVPLGDHRASRKVDH